MSGDDFLNIELDDIDLDIDQILSRTAKIKHDSVLMNETVIKHDTVEIGNDFSLDLNGIDEIDLNVIDNNVEIVDGLNSIDSNISELNSSFNDGDPIISCDTDLLDIKFSQSDSLLDDGDKKKLIKAAERHVRSSHEYSKYLGFLKNELDMTRCSFFSAVDAEVVSIEMHHYPFTLFELCDIVMTKQSEKGEKITSFSIANEVLKLHYSHMCGLVPLSKTVHQLAHAGEVFINLNQVFGNITEFLRRYGEFIDKEILLKLSKIVVLSDRKASPIGDKEMLAIKDQDYTRDVNEINILEINQLKSLIVRDEEEIK